MVLEHVTDHARFLVILAARFHADRFSDRDLYLLYVLPVPERLEDRVREPEDENVLNRLFPQIVIDPVHLMLGEPVQHEAVQRARRFETPAEGLLYDDACPRPRFAHRYARCNAARREVSDRRLEDTGRDGEIEKPVPFTFRQLALHFGEAGAHSLVRIGCRQITVHISDTLFEPAPRRIVHRFDLVGFSKRLAHRERECGISHRIAANAKKTESLGKKPLSSERIERRHELSPHEVAARAEDHRRTPVRSSLPVARPRWNGKMRRDMRCSHVFFTACPPNSLRSAAITFAENESSCRERSRIRSDSVMTGAGTSRSIAS